MIRTIMVFPEFDNMDIIDGIRDRYDPLAKLVRPHITLVFPFEDCMTNEEVERVLERRLAGIRPFRLKMSGITKQEDRFGNYLMLNVIEGKEELRHIHNELYANEFASYDLGLVYNPHITVGKLPGADALGRAYDDVRHIQEIFETVVDTVSVEMIGDNEESIIVLEKKLID